MLKIKVIVPVFILSALLLFLLINLIQRNDLPYIDQWAIDLVNQYSNPHIYTVALWFTKLGSKPFLIPFTLLMGFVLFFLFRDWVPPIIFGGGTYFSHLLNSFLKDLVVRERPRILIEASAEGFSFPSGHAMIPMVCYGLLMSFLIMNKTAAKFKAIYAVLFPLLILLIGISRVIINVHYLTDVIAGFLIGFNIVLCLLILNVYIQKRRKAY